MLFMSKATNLKLNTKEGAIRFENGQFITEDKKLQQAIKETVAFKTNKVISVTEKELKQESKKGSKSGDK